MRIATTKVERHDTEGALKVVKASYETARAHLLKACEEWGKRKDEKANQEVEEARTVLVGAGYSKMVETLGSGTTESVHRVLIELFVGGQYHEDVE